MGFNSGFKGLNTWYSSLRGLSPRANYNNSKHKSVSAFRMHVLFKYFSYDFSNSLAIVLSIWGFWFSVIWRRVCRSISSSVSEELVAAIFEVVQKYKIFFGMLVLMSLTRIWYVPKGNGHHNRLLTLKYCQHSHETAISEVVITTAITVHTPYTHKMCWRLLPAVI